MASQPRYIDITPEAFSEIAKSIEFPTSDTAVTSEAPACDKQVNGKYEPNVRIDLKSQIINAVEHWLLKEFVLPLVKQVTDEYMIPWIKEQFGEWFYKRTEREKSDLVQVPIMNSDKMLHTDESTEEPPRENKKIISFSA